MVLAVAGVSALAWAGFRRWRSREKAEASKSEQGKKTEHSQVLREQVLDVARAREFVLPEQSRGHNPTIVTFSDGQVSWFYSDFSAYQRGMSTPGAVNPQRTWFEPPPHPVSQWETARLEKWLKDHAD